MKDENVVGEFQKAFKFIMQVIEKLETHLNIDKIFALFNVILMAYAI